MTISNNFNEEIRKYSGKNYFTILYDGYKKVLILFDELEKKQFGRALELETSTIYIYRGYRTVCLF